MVSCGKFILFFKIKRSQRLSYAQRPSRQTTNTVFFFKTTTANLPQKSSMHTRNFHKHGFRYVFNPATTHFLPISGSQPTVSLLHPQNLVVLCVTDTIYVMQKHLATKIEIVQHKLNYEETFEVSLWGKNLKAIEIQSCPYPHLFAHMVLKLYGQGTQEQKEYPFLEMQDYLMAGS